MDVVEWSIELFEILSAVLSYREKEIRRAKLILQTACFCVIFSNCNSVNSSKPIAT